MGRAGKLPACTSIQVLTIDTAGGTEFYSNTRLEGMTGGYCVVYPDGTTNTYTMQAIIGGESRYYLTEVVDRGGQKLQFHYEEQGSNPSVARLLEVVWHRKGQRRLGWDHAAIVPVGCRERVGG